MSPPSNNKKLPEHIKPPNKQNAYPEPPNNCIGCKHTKENNCLKELEIPDSFAECDNYDMSLRFINKKINEGKKKEVVGLSRFIYKKKYKTTILTI